MTDKDVVSCAAGGALFIGLLAGWLAGCATGNPLRTTSLLNQLRQGGPTGPDAVVIDVALLERPVGDAYINRDLWAVADEQVVALERKALLEDNGLRVGQVGGIMPNELLDLLTSERSCINPRRFQVQAGNTTPVLLGPRIPLARYQLSLDGPPVPIGLEQAECGLEVVPALTADGRVRLQFTPRVRHGEPALRPSPAPDRSGWVLTEQQPSERYPALSWEVTLGPNQFLVVGARFDRPGTLGHQCFVRPDEQFPVQRLLVIRTAPLMPSTDPDALFLTEDYFASLRSPPLAFQATFSTARGVAP